MWIHWNKATNLFHAEEVSRILSFPAPRLNDLVRIDMKDYALCYQFPSSPTGFQNFSMWPLFTCLSIPNIVGVIEAAVSPTRRIIFVSHYPAMLTVAAETVRSCVRVYEWSGLYEPVVHARHINELVQEPGPYILGITAECRTLFTAPTDALVIDLDRNFVLTSSPPSSLSAGQRTKMINRLTQALSGDVTPSGVPAHLRSAYGGGKLIPAGQIIVMRGEVESVQDPQWWSQDNVMSVMDHVCEKLVSLFFFYMSACYANLNQGRNTGMKAIFGGATKKPLMTKVSMRHLNEVVRERNQYNRDAVEAWQDFINLKGRMDTELSKVSKRNNFLVEELESWKQQVALNPSNPTVHTNLFCLQFLKFQAFAEQLTKETQDLKVKIESHKRENRRLTVLIDQQKDDAARLTIRLSGTEKQRDDALEALVLQQEIAEELERERKRNKKALSALQHTNKSIYRQRDEAQRVVIHLRSLIDGQTHHMEHIVRSLNQAPEITGYIGPEYADGPEDADDGQSVAGSEYSKAAGSVTSSRIPSSMRKHSRRSLSLTGSMDGVFKNFDGDHVTPEMERRFFNSPAGERSKRYSELSMADVADRHLRDKTDAIADIIRNISDQCAAAVEGLQLAHDAEQEEGQGSNGKHARRDISTSDDGHSQSVRTEGSEIGEGVSEGGFDESSYLSPDGRHSSIPSTPDLVHGRSSTSMSMDSSSTTFNRRSQQFSQPGMSTKIAHEDEVSELGSDIGHHDNAGTYLDYKKLRTDDTTPIPASRIVT